MKFDVPTDLKDTLETVLKDHGTNIKTGLTRLIEWYLQQPPAVRAGVVDKNGDANEEIWRERNAKKLAEGKKYETTAGLDALTALRQIRELADVVEINVRAKPKK